MVVIVVIGILSAMIIPEMKGTYEDGVLRSTGRDLVTAFSLASSRAVSLGQTKRVLFDLQSGRYLVESQNRRSGTRAPGFAPDKDMLGGDGRLDERVFIEVHKPAEDAAAESEFDGSRGEPGPAANLGVEFYPDGTAQAADVLLRDRDGFRLCLRVSPVTARVRIIDLGRE